VERWKFLLDFLGIDTGRGKQRGEERRDYAEDSPFGDLTFKAPEMLGDDACFFLQVFPLGSRPALSDQAPPPPVQARPLGLRPAPFRSGMLSRAPPLDPSPAPSGSDTPTQAPRPAPSSSAPPPSRALRSCPALSAGRLGGAARLVPPPPERARGRAELRVRGGMLGGRGSG
jgi:hypothetical protein